tara:strand:+ start:2065 stop:2325 length:261 start_codon:yes stop_codon:yes gene_type:complete
MITDEERKKLKKIFGAKHITKIREFFVEKKIHSREGEPYSQSFVSRVFNGRDRHDVVETAIFDAAIDYKMKMQEQEDRRKEILSNV